MMIILDKFCLISAETRSRQVGEALLADPDHMVLLPDERFARMYAERLSDLGAPAIHAALVLKIVAEAWGYLPTLVEYQDHQRAGMRISVNKRERDGARHWRNMGYTRQGDHIHFGFDGSDGQPGRFYNSGETFNLRFTYTMDD